MTSCSDSLYLERRDPARNMARYYSFSIESDLFEGVLAVRRWGRIGTSGRRVSVACPDRGAALAALAAVERVKRRRGYAEPRE
ncbi:WGR domain-containing protein [Rhizobium sp.]